MLPRSVSIFFALSKPKKRTIDRNHFGFCDEIFKILNAIEKINPPSLFGANTLR